MSDAGQVHRTPVLQAPGCGDIGLSAEGMDMKQGTGIEAAPVSLNQVDDGRRAARLVGLSMGLLFILISVLQALSF